MFYTPYKLTADSTEQYVIMIRNQVYKFNIRNLADQLTHDAIIAKLREEYQDETFDSTANFYSARSINITFSLKYEGEDELEEFTIITPKDHSIFNVSEQSLSYTRDGVYRGDAQISIKRVAVEVGASPSSERSTWLIDVTSDYTYNQVLTFNCTDENGVKYFNDLVIVNKGDDALLAAETAVATTLVVTTPTTTKSTPVVTATVKSASVPTAPVTCADQGKEWNEEKGMCVAPVTSHVVNGYKIPNTATENLVAGFASLLSLSVAALYFTLKK